MKTVNAIQTTITENNGFIPSNVLADVLGKNHSDLTKKMKQQLDKNTLSKISERQESYNNGKNTRKIYLLPEAEGMGLAMHYDVSIGIIVYRAFKSYEKALIEIATGVANPRQLAIDALFAINLNATSTYKQIIKTVYVNHKLPTDAADAIWDFYEGAPKFNKETRKTWFNSWESVNRAQMVENCKSVDDFNKQAAYKSVESDILKKQRSLARNNCTRQTNKVSKVTEKAVKAVKVAKHNFDKAVELKAKYEKAKCAATKAVELAKQERNNQRSVACN